MLIVLCDKFVIFLIQILERDLGGDLYSWNILKSFNILNYYEYFECIDVMLD